MDYEYKVSVIVPCYNVEDYLADCLDSLVNQTIDKDQMEILCINDGSTDNTLSILREYEEKYTNVKVFTKENEGLSATRNYGIKRAKGKYMMYIDSDDMFTLETVEKVTDFFDTVYDKVDMVTFYDQPYTNEINLPVHFRFDHYLKKDGVYDLNKYPYICQMRVNVCVKNMGEDNLLFDTTPGFKQEDQEYNNRVLMAKMKIGYCSGGCYLYNKSNGDSIVTTSFNAINLFESSMDYFERLFGMFEGKVPPYFQAIYFHDIRWKLGSRILFPYHYDDEALEAAKERVFKLLERVDVSTILGYPAIDEKQRFYWLSKKKNAVVTPFATGGNYSLLCEGKTIHSRKEMPVYFINARTDDKGNLVMRMYVADPLYNFIKDYAKVYVTENREVSKLLPVYISKFSYLPASERIAKYYAFEYVCNPRKVKNFSFHIMLDGFRITPFIKFFIHARFNRPNKIFDYVEGNIRFQFRNQEFFVDILSDEEVYKLEAAHTVGYFKNDKIVNLRLDSIEYRKSHRVWLYSDLYTVKKDNGYYQFINDFGKDDGIERYYVYTRPYEEIEYLFTDEQKKWLVEFGSEKHKLLFLASEMIFSAFFGRSPISPFENENDEVAFYDIEHFKVVYLQHGVLHASLLVQNSAENMRADKVVVSSQFEIDNYMNKYHYRRDQLVETGMARYDHIDRNRKPKGRILFAPSWRNYLAPNTSPSSWKINLNSFLKSNYYNNIKALLESDELIKMLEEKDMYFEFKLHPIIAKEATSLFDFKSDRIVAAESEVDLEDYDMFITDFSSFVFDYGYLNRPVLYFVPDYNEFKSGMGHYRELDLPFEDAFGPLTTDADSAVKEILKVAANNFVPEEVYGKRMEEFYVPMNGDCCENLYKYVMENMFKEGLYDYNPEDDEEEEYIVDDELISSVTDDRYEDEEFDNDKFDGSSDDDEDDEDDEDGDNDREDDDEDGDDEEDDD